LNSGEKKLIDGVMETPTGKVSDGYMHQNLIVFSESEPTDRNSLLSGNRRDTEITRQDSA